MRTQIVENPYLPDADAPVPAWNKKGIWPCRWVGCVGVGEPPFVCAYRLRFTMEQAATIRVHVTADERYELFLDGERIGRGSERGDGDHWFFETYDLELTQGEHIFVARVWSLGSMAPFAQMTVHPGFLFAPQNQPYISRLGTGNADWEAKRLNGYQLVPPSAAWGTGANLIVDGSRYDWEWEIGNGEDWQTVVVLGEGSSSQRNDRPMTHVLEPATLPPMREDIWQGGSVRYVGELPATPAEQSLALDGKEKKFTCGLPIRGVDHLPEEAAQWSRLWQGGGCVTIPPQTCRRILIDLENYVCAYPELVTSEGTGSLVRIHWQESLFEEPDTKNKGSRDEIEGKYFITIWHKTDGIGDAFLPDGGTNRCFDTLWWQCGRYVEIVVQTGDEPLTVNSFRVRETRCPLEMQSRFECSDSRLMDVSGLMLRALQMCSHETYMDCPYYEQLMYIGDTRLQALTTYAITSDARLPRKALRMFDISRRLDGLTQSRYPTRVFQSIPPFSLWWVAMLHDFARWRNEPDFVREMLPGARGVVEHFIRHIDAEGRLWASDGWNCFDWVPTWKDGTPPDGQAGVSGPLTWTMIYILRLLGELETWAGERELSARMQRIAGQLAARAADDFWNEERGLFADDRAHKHFSEHSQSIALLGGLLDPQHRERMSANLLTAHDLARATIYFSHYLFEAYHLLGRTDKMLERMDLWFDLKARGLKTTVEMPEPTRSDCHAWGAHPLYHYFASILGIRPASFGFRTVRIAPDLGTLEWAKGSLAHPRGDIAVELHREGESLRGSITLPDKIRGAFSYKGMLIPLPSGSTKINIVHQDEW